MWHSARTFVAVRSPLPLVAALALTLALGVSAAVSPALAPERGPGVTTADAAALPTPVPLPPAALVAGRGRSDLSAYRGLGTWLDAYDWSPELGGTTPLSAVDEMARRGVRTLYLQAAKEGARTPGALLSPGLLGRFLVRAHAHGMKVQAWYLPLMTDPAADRRHLDAVLAFRAQGQRFDTVGLDIEWRNGVPDVAERNRRVVALSRYLRARAPGLPLAAVVVAPVVTEDVNRSFWRPFPWQELGPLFDVWQPMGYWTDRKTSSRWSDAYASTQANVHYLRRNLGRADLPVHPIGGVGAATGAQAAGFVRAAREERVLGGSLYDWPTTAAARYGELRRVPR